MSTEKLWNFTLQEEMVLSESTIPNLLSGPVNIKWGKELLHRLLLYAIALHYKVVQCILKYM